MPAEPRIEKDCELLREQIETLGQNLLKAKLEANQFPPIESEDRGEVMANLMLAYRHLEDARMRLGKVYQARNSGISNSTR
jgi:hypothetical protein